MINYQGIQVTNLYTEGFEVTFPSSMTIAFGPGSLVFVEGDSKTIYAFNELEFDIEVDPELSVVYDVYLLRDVDSNGLNIQVDRTEIGMGGVAIYEGTAPLLHCLLSLFVPAGTTHVDELSVNVRNIIQVEEAITDED